MNCQTLISHFSRTIFRGKLGVVLTDCGLCIVTFFEEYFCKMLKHVFQMMLKNIKETSTSQVFGVSHQVNFWDQHLPH